MAKKVQSKTDDLITRIANSVRDKVKGLEQIYVGGEAEVLGVSEWLPTDIVVIDWMLGKKGLPYTRAIELFGDFSSGKTWFVYLMLGRAQKNGSIAALIETEGSYDPEMARLAGVDTDKLIVISPKTVEDVFNSISALFDANDSDTPLVIGYDSIAATSTEHELEEGMEKRDMSKAFKMAQGLRIVTNKISEKNGMFLAVNQLRDKIGVMFGEKETTTGGRAMGFTASVRLKFTKIGKIFDDPNAKDKEVIGQRFKIECVKSKVFVPFKRAEIELYYNRPVNKYTGLFELLEKNGLVIKDGNMYVFVGGAGGKWKKAAFDDVIQTPDGQAVLQMLMSLSAPVSHEPVNNSVERAPREEV